MRAAAAAILLAALVCACGPAPEAQQQRPNVVVLMTDDQTLESLRVMTGTRSALAARGTTFDRAFVSTALCCPSRATLFTGQYAHNHGVLSNRQPEGGYGRLDTSEWLPVWLQRAGYATVHVGKFLNRYGQDSPPTQVPNGWSEWYASVDPSTYRYSGYLVNENGTVRRHDEYSTDQYAARAQEVIGRLAPGDTPFFLSVGFLAPHGGQPREPDDPAGLPTPAPAARHHDAFAHEPPPRGPSVNEADVSDKPSFIRARRRLGPLRRATLAENYRQELESLLAVDEAVVGVVGALRDAGELERTLIVFTSDNGFFHGEHRVGYGKVMVYEPSIRVPLIMAGPGVPARQRRRQLVTNADLAPTILDAANAAPARIPDGRSLFPLLADRGLEWGRDLYFEGPAGVRAVAYSALRTYRYLYAEHENGERELYDLKRDPDELRNLDADPRTARLQGRLAERLAALQVCAGESCRTSPPVSLRLRGCSGRVTGTGVERVRLTRRRGSLRARVRTRDGRVVTLDRRLPRTCR